MSEKNIPLKSEKIFALNLTARAAKTVAGNPVTTRMESGVSNCFPGLEFDHRNLDRRFFPGLVFEFVSSDDNLRQGARLVQVDLNDPDLDPTNFVDSPADQPDANIQGELATALFGDPGTALSEEGWFLESITQGGKTISLHQRARGRPPLDGMTTWRLVRSLQPEPVKIVLVRRPKKEGDKVPAPRRMKLRGWRRKFVSANTGVISEAYTPGELTQSLCSPWMHDFRDCACTYWASNHPDIVVAEENVGGAEIPLTENPLIDNTPIDWLRADRWPARTAAAEGTEGQNREAEMDHYEINQRWQDLSIVLAGHEVSRIFNAREADSAKMFETPDLLAAELVKLAELEHAVALEYLYAMYSVKNPANVRDASLRNALTFVRHEILMIAVSEMRHLRWANQLIWELEHANLTTKKWGPSLGIAETVPAKGKPQPPELKPLDSQTLQSFIDIEQPSGTLDGQYARVVATLRQPRYSSLSLEQLAARILADGMQHYSKFREIQVILTPYLKTSPPLYLRTITKAPINDPGAQKAMTIYRTIIDDLKEAYGLGDMEDAHHIADARTKMFDLKEVAENLANRGLGVPYF
jgi:Ferritin-like